MASLVAPTHPVPLHPGLPLLGNTLAFLHNPLIALNELQQRHERLIHLRIGGRHQYLVFSPEDAKHILQENHRNYGRSPAFEILKIFLGNGLLTSDGDYWRRQRRLAQPAFHRQKLVALATTMITETAVWITDLKQRTTQQPVNVSQALMNVTMRIVCQTLFGTDLVGNMHELSAALDSLNYLANHRIMSPFRFPLHWPTPNNVRLRQARTFIDSFIYSVIKIRRQDQLANAHRDDLLSLLLSAEDEETGEKMSDLQLRDECVTLFSAGHETTAVSLAWALLLLSQHPTVLMRLQTEVQRVLGDNPLPTADQFRSLSYTLQVIQESLRLYPPAWILSRLAHNPDQVGPYTIPMGGTALICPYLLHRDPDSWPEPEQFDPDRFAPGGLKEQIHAYAYLPFGGGPRLCIGNQFALLEMQIILAMIVRTFTIKPIPAQQITPKPLVTLRPDKPIHLQLIEN